MDHFKFRSQNPNSSSTTSSSSSSFPGHKGKNGNTKRSTSTLSTDPQSVAARERRHRISDRFKILQSMVPGGSKMDTVSMLDDAISYVKFLKAQIWIHQNMLFFNDHETTSSCTYSPAGVGDIEPVFLGNYDGDYAPVTEAHSQGMPLKVTDSEYSKWFGSVDGEQEETMHRRGLF